MSRTQNQPTNIEAKMAEPIKRLELPSFIELSRGEFICHCNSCKSKNRSPVFNDISTLKAHVESQKENRGFKWDVCSHCLEKGFETHVPATPGCNYEHLRKYHKHVLRNLGLSHKKYSPVFKCFTCDEFSTYMHIHCYNCPNENGKGYMSFACKEDLNAHLKKNHPIHNHSNNCRITKQRPSRRYNCQRRKVIDLHDEQGNQVDALCC